MVKLKMNLLRASFFVIMFVAVPASAQELTVDDVSWMSGCWLHESGNSRIAEHWMAPEGGLMVGMSRSVRGGRATGYEFVLMRIVEGKLIYSANPSGQTPTDFSSTEVREHFFRVTNPEHDFPQKIEYERTADDRVDAHVYGGVDDTTPSFSLHYKKTPCY